MQIRKKTDIKCLKKKNKNKFKINIDLRILI